MQNNATYLLSSFEENSDEFFQGYCFDKEDFIFGQSGADEYLKATGKDISFGEDGCYVLAKKVGENFVIGSDSAGYKKILYFHDKKLGVWVVSNSIVLMIEHLTKHSIQITPNLESLLMLSIEISATQQPMTFDTIVKEISILPINTVLTIGKNNLNIEKVQDKEVDIINYNEIILNFANMWASRFSTLMSCGNVLIQQALTGGLDSRAVFSLSHLAYENIDSSNNSDYRLSSYLTNGSDIDIKIADKISSYYGYELNRKGNSVYKVKYLSDEDNYLTWKNTCLGLYQPIYFPESEIDYKKVKIGGGGGENYRPFYTKRPNTNNYSDFVKLLCSKLNKKNLQLGFAINLYETLLRIQDLDQCGKEIDPLILHYRHFRNRFHTGLSPQYRVSFNPLSSKYLANIAKKDNYKKIQNLQVLYDLINLTDNLLSLPYDDPKKAPVKENFDQRIKVNSNISIKKGSIFVGQSVEKDIKSKSSKSVVFKYLKEDFDRACNTKLVKELWNEDFINKASRVLDKAIVNGKFASAKEGIPISTIIATGLFRKNTVISN